MKVYNYGIEKRIPNRVHDVNEVLLNHLTAEQI